MVLALSLLAACGRSTHAVPWQLTGAADGLDLPLVADFGGSTCDPVLKWKVSETAAEVHIRAFVESGIGGCSADSLQEEGSVHLDEPLGARRLTGCEPDNPTAECDAPTP